MCLPVLPPGPHSCIQCMKSLPSFLLDSISLPQEQLFPPLFSLFSPFGPNHSAENVKPAVLGMLPNETVLLNILFLPKYFQSSWRAVRPQRLSAAFPSSISPGFPSTALSNWILFEEEGEKLLHETVCRFKNYPLGTEGERSKVLGCQTPGLGDCVSFLDEAFREETQRTDAGNGQNLDCHSKVFRLFFALVM